MFTKELIERMKKKNITIEKTMKGLWEYATITLEEGRTLDTMDYDVYDGQAPNSVMFSIMIDNEAVYEDLSTDEEVLKYVLKLLNEENQTTNIKHGIVDYEEGELYTDIKLS